MIAITMPAITNAKIKNWVQNHSRGIVPEAIVSPHDPEAGRLHRRRRELTELLAAHAAIAITNAQLYERSRELSILSERNRLALELHDVVSQKLFSLNLAAETAATLVERDAGREPALGAARDAGVRDSHLILS